MLTFQIAFGILERQAVAASGYAEAVHLRPARAGQPASDSHLLLFRLFLFSDAVTYSHPGFCLDLSAEAAGC